MSPDAASRNPGGLDEARRRATDGQAELLRLADRLLDLARAAGATEAEVLASADDAALTRFANSEIHQNVAESNVGLNLRFVDGRRIGVAATGRTDDAALRGLAERAAAIARLANRGPAAYSVSRHLSEGFPALVVSAFRRTGETVQGVFDEF